MALGAAAETSPSAFAGLALGGAAGAMEGLELPAPALARACQPPKRSPAPISWPSIDPAHRSRASACYLLISDATHGLYVHGPPSPPHLGKCCCSLTSCNMDLARAAQSCRHLPACHLPLPLRCRPENLLGAATPDVRKAEQELEKRTSAEKQILFIGWLWLDRVTVAR